MKKRVSDYIEHISVSPKDLIVVIGSFFIIGGGILGYMWYQTTHLARTSVINNIESTDATPAPVFSQVEVRNVTAHSAEIRWSLTGQPPVTVQYGTAQEQLENNKRLYTGNSIVILEGLSPRTRYFFRLVGGVTDPVSISSIYSFRTP